MLISGKKEKALKAYILLSAGPHYISGAPERQIPGFIFSDNLAAGTYIRLSDTVDLDFRLGARHLSNASFKKPNGGINTINLHLGVIFRSKG